MSELDRELKDFIARLGQAENSSSNLEEVLRILNQTTVGPASSGSVAAASGHASLSQAVNAPSNLEEVLRMLNQTTVGPASSGSVAEASGLASLGPTETVPTSSIKPKTEPPRKQATAATTESKRHASTSSVKQQSLKERVLEAQMNQRIVNLMARVEKVKNNVFNERDKDIVAFVGPTKSGKSTLINCLLGTPLTYIGDNGTGDAYIVKSVGAKGGPEIGADIGESETESPESYGNFPGTNNVMWDFPGFDDNKGSEQEVLNAIACKNILTGQKSVRFVAVFSGALIKSENPLPFYELLYKLQTLCPNTVDSLCIVCTKLDKGTAKGALEKTLTAKFYKAEESKRKVIGEAQKLISQILRKGSYVDFKAPEFGDDNEMGAFNAPNLKEIVSCIENLKGARTGEAPLIISFEAQRDIADLYAYYYDKVNKNIEVVVGFIRQLVRTKLRDASLESEPQVKVALYRSGRDLFLNVTQQAQDFKALLAGLETLGLAVKESFAGDIERFCFLEELKSMYKEIHAGVRGEEEFYKIVLSDLNDGLLQLTNLLVDSEVLSAEQKRLEWEFKKRLEREAKKIKEELVSLRSASNLLQNGLRLLSERWCTIL